MNQTSVTYGQDIKFAELLVKKKFSGSSGALSYFHDVYETPMHREIAQGNFSLARKCIDLHLEASRFYSEGSFFKRRHAVVFASKAAHLADILKEKTPSDELTAEDCYLWISSHVALITLSGTKAAQGKSIRLKSLLNEMSLRLYALCKEDESKLFSEEEGSSICSLEHSQVIDKCSPLHLKYPDIVITTQMSQKKMLIEMMLYRLCVDGLYTLDDPYVARERLWAYAMFHEGSTNLDLLETVSKLFSALSDVENMEKVKARISELKSRTPETA
jgi:hypothetical protein